MSEIVVANAVSTNDTVDLIMKSSNTNAGQVSVYANGQVRIDTDQTTGTTYMIMKPGANVDIVSADDIILDATGNTIIDGIISGTNIELATTANTHLKSNRLIINAVANAQFRTPATGVHTDIDSGLVKAQGYFDGTGTPAFEGTSDQNFSSITDNSTGNYNLNYTNNMASTYHSAAATSTVSLGTAPDQTRCFPAVTDLNYLHYDDEPATAKDVAVNLAIVTGTLA
jgi:hypothetical protein